MSLAPPHMLDQKWEVADELTGNEKLFTKTVIFFSFLVPSCLDNSVTVPEYLLKMHDNQFSLLKTCLITINDGIIKLLPLSGPERFGGGVDS